MTTFEELNNLLALDSKESFTPHYKDLDVKFKDSKNPPPKDSNRVPKLLFHKM